MRNTFVLRLVTMGLGLAGMAAAQGGPPSTPFVTHQLAPNVYWVEGGGGNSGVIVGETGVIVIDAKTSAAGGKELLEDIAKITPKPVKTVILTHSDGDHVNGLASFPTGITIIAHEGNKAEQEAALKAGGRGAPPADHLPTRVVTGKGEDVTLDGIKLRLLHWASCAYERRFGDLPTGSRDHVCGGYRDVEHARSADSSGEERQFQGLD